MERIFESCFIVVICRILSSTRSSAQHIIYSRVLLPFLYFEVLSQNMRLGGNTVPPLIEPECKDFLQRFPAIFFFHAFPCIHLEFAD